MSVRLIHIDDDRRYHRFDKEDGRWYEVRKVLSKEILSLFDIEYCPIQIGYKDSDINRPNDIKNLINLLNTDSNIIVIMNLTWMMIIEKILEQRSYENNLLGMEVYSCEVWKNVDIDNFLKTYENISKWVNDRSDWPSILIEELKAILNKNL